MVRIIWFLVLVLLILMFSFLWVVIILLGWNVFGLIVFFIVGISRVSCIGNVCVMISLVRFSVCVVLFMFFFMLCMLLVGLMFSLLVLKYMFLLISVMCGWFVLF